MTNGSNVTQNTKHTNGNDVTQNTERQKYLARKYGSSVRMNVETPTPQRNDKWEQRDTKHTNLFNEKKITPYRVPPHPNSGRYSDTLGNYDVRYLAGRVATRNKNGFCPM
jgi:hypothetical protein